MSESQSPNSVLRAQRFELVDAKNRPWAFRNALASDQMNGQLIDAWLKQNPNVKSVVILTDVKDAYPKATDADWDTYVACMEKLEPLVRDYAIASYTQVDLNTVVEGALARLQGGLSGLAPMPRELTQDEIRARLLAEG